MNLRTLGLAIGLLFLAAFAGGCGGNSTDADKLYKEGLGRIDEVTAAIEKRAPEAEVAAKWKRVEEANKKFEALDVSEDVRKELRDKYKTQREATGKRFLDALVGAAQDGKKYDLPARDMNFMK